MQKLRKFYTIIFIKDIFEDSKPTKPLRVKEKRSFFIFYVNFKQNFEWLIKIRLNAQIKINIQYISLKSETMEGKKNKKKYKLSSDPNSSTVS